MTYFEACLFSDFVSNSAMARQGFSRMAVSACFGGPLLSILIQYTAWIELDENALGSAVQF